MKKKLTRGGGAPLVLTLIALIISLIAAFEEYLFRFIYNLAFDKKADKIFVSDITGIFSMDRDSVSVIRVYTEKAFIMTVIALIAFIVLAASARKKKIVAGEAWMMITSAAACTIEPIIYMSYFFSNGLQENFSADNDGVRFRSFYGFLIYALPILAAALLIIAGFILLIRLAKEQAVEIAVEEDTYTEPVSDTYQPEVPIAQPQAAAVMAEVVIPQQPLEPAVDIRQAADAQENITAPVMEQITPVAEAAPTEETVVTEDLQAQPLITHEPDPAVQKVFCANCGQQLEPSARFCNNCGTKRG